MTSAFYRQNAISLCHASLCTPRPKLPVTASVSWLSPLAFQFPIVKGHLFWMLVLEGLVHLYINIQLQLLQHYWLGHRFGLLWYWMVCLGNWWIILVIFEIVSKYCISDSFVDCDGYSISSKGFLHTAVDIMIIWVKFTHSVHFSALIPKVSKLKKKFLTTKLG